VKKEITNILIGSGLGEIRFGWSKDQLEKYLGTPDEKDDFTYPVSEDTEVGSESWHYDEYEFSASFNEEDEWKLGALAVSSDEFLLNGKKLIGLSREAFLNEIKDLNLGEYDEEDWSSDENPDQKLMAFADTSINFWFEDGFVTEIQWGPMFNEEDEPIWPEK
jgi:hypothetical protein